MKKLFAILLIIAMLVPLGLTAQAESVEKKGFYLVNYGRLTDADPSVTKDFTNTYYMPKIECDAGWVRSGIVIARSPHIGSSGGRDEDGAKKLAADVKAWFEKNNIPEGARYINFNIATDAVRNMNEYCFVGKTIPVLSKWMDAFCKELKALGGELDGVALDVEFLGIYNNYIYNGGDGITFSAQKDPLLYKKIEEHPEYKEKIRPLLVERGFKFYSPVSDTTPEIFSIQPNSGAEYAQSRAIWNAVMRSYLADSLTEGCAPLWEYYPDAVLSDYTAKNKDPWFKELSSGGGVNTSSGGSHYTVGNSSNDNFYGFRPSTTFFKDSNGAVAYPTMPGYNNAIFTNTPFNRFLFEMNTGKGTYLASDNGQVSFWLAHAYYDPPCYNAYWSELILHLAMLDPQIFLGYILKQDCKNDAKMYANALLITDQNLRMVSNLAGYADRKPLNVAHNWNYPFVLSGMYANGRNIFRITPDTTDMKLEDFQVKDAKDPTFQAKGITVTFPGGKIIKDSEVYDIGTCGYWVETAKDVTPIITKADNYNTEYAAYQETFDAFEVGMDYNYNNAKPDFAWEPQKQGAITAKIVADPTNASKNMLAITGNYELKNVKLPDNITGADTYAKNQAWEISFILPNDMAADAELQLLYAIHDKNKFKDTGIRVTGGKVFYDNAGESVELEGVTLTAGVKYTVVREFDFTNAEAYTCRYYVYDAEGKVIGKTAKVPTPAKWEIPVTTIAYATKKVTGNPVLFDDYKLYTTKVNTDFYLYDAKTGIPVETADMDKPREGATAYRFAWLNSTNTEKSYTIMAAYYDGETKVSEEVVKEVKLAPYFNGFEAGEFENKQEGKKMLIYVKDNNPAEEEDVPTTGGDEPIVDDDKNGSDGLDTQMIIIIAAAAAAVVIVVVVIVIVASAKKKKKAAAAAVEAPAAEEATEETAEETTEEVTEETTEENTEE